MPLVGCPPCGRVSELSKLQPWTSFSLSTGARHTEYQCPFCGHFSLCHLWVEVSSSKPMGLDVVSSIMGPEDDRFPHDCPFCGKKAYIGAGYHGVEHADGKGCR